MVEIACSFRRPPVAFERRYETPPGEQALRALQVGKDLAEGRSQMDRINPVEAFPEAGVRRDIANAKEVPDHRTPSRFALGTPVKFKE
ncbi:MAG: hypothetical protein OXF46_10845 [Rhodobacteraceae bacterium]|nr:hypothetical protein [Paracoccaceae bacterium]